MALLLDTNVLSELMRAQPAHEVLNWFAQQEHQPKFTSSVTQAEILTGIALLSAGKRRTALAHAAEALFTQTFAERCLAFDAAAAPHYALIVATRTQLGQPISTEDAQIAAIALAQDLALVTRNTRDFVQIKGLKVLDPWQA